MGTTNTRSLLTAFGGLNETYSCAEGELSGCMNFSGRGYPALQTRSPRRRMYDLPECGGMYHLNGLLTVQGKNLIWTPDDTERQTVTLENAVTEGKKTLIGMGTRVLIWPDAVSFDTEDGSLTSLAAEWEQGSADTVLLQPCDAGGKTYTVTESGAAEPEAPADGQLFLKLNNTASPEAYVNVLEQYSAASGKWAEIPLNYLKVSCGGSAGKFRQGDTVTLSGIPEQALQYIAPDIGGEVELQMVQGDSFVMSVSANTESLYYYGRFEITAGSVKWYGADGVQKSSLAAKGAVKLQRRVPTLEYVTECNNRIWGCSSRENVIYACKLGDPTNWFAYRGIASDSYAVTVGSDGAFTGAATCRGYALFFKENALHKIYGSKPGDYQLVTTQCRGVARGAGRSLCVIAEVLYYLSLDGVMAWDGSLPEKVSGKLDATKLANVSAAVGSALDARYYLHLRTRAEGIEEARLLVYDTERGMWHEESATGWEMVSTGRQLYLWDGEAVWAADPDREYDRGETAEGVESGVRFEATSGDIGMTMPDDKYINRVTLRIDALARSEIRVQINCDGEGWETVGEVVTRDRFTRVNLPFCPRRCDMLRLRICGVGQVAVRSIAFSLANADGARVQGGSCKK